MFLTLIPLPTFFIITQISLVVFIVKNATFAFLYPLILNTVYIYKRKKTNFYDLHKMINNFIHTTPKNIIYQMWLIIVYTQTQKGFYYLHKVFNNFRVFLPN